MAPRDNTKDGVGGADEPKPETGMLSDVAQLGYVDIISLTRKSARAVMLTYACSIGMKPMVVKVC